MKRLGIIAAMGLLLLGLCGKASAQFFGECPDMKGRIVYGGNLGFGMSGNYLNLSLAPQVGYRIFSPWEVGVRGTYNLQCYFDRIYGNQYAHYFGVAPYTNFEVFRGLFLHVEDEEMYGFARWNNETVQGKWFNSIFVGGGYRQYNYSGGGVFFMVLYNLGWENLQNWEGLYPYYSPLEIRVGYCF